jgi:hypothetical protein
MKYTIKKGNEIIGITYNPECAEDWKKDGYTVTAKRDPTNEETPIYDKADKMPHYYTVDIGGNPDRNVLESFMSMIELQAQVLGLSVEITGEFYSTPYKPPTEVNS